LEFKAESYVNYFVLARYLIFQAGKTGGRIQKISHTISLHKSFPCIPLTCITRIIHKFGIRPSVSNKNDVSGSILSRVVWHQGLFSLSFWLFRVFEASSILFKAH